MSAIQFWSDQWDYDRPTMAMLKAAREQLDGFERDYLAPGSGPSSTAMWSMRSAYHILACNYWRRRAFKAERGRR